jgi:hypothetical protein
MELRTKFEVGESVWIVAWEVVPKCPTCGLRDSSSFSLAKRIVIGPRVIEVVRIASNGEEAYSFDINQDYPYARMPYVFKTQAEAEADLQKQNADYRYRYQ